MLEYDLPDWSGVPEPTEADLAEVDAALAAAPRTPPDCPADAWLDGYAVRKAFDAAGLPDGTGTWQARFAAHLFGIADAIGERISTDQVDGLLHIASVERRALHDADSGERINPGIRFTQNGAVGSVRVLLQYMDLEGCAGLLGVTEERLRERLWNVDLDLLRSATTAFMDGMPLRDAAQACGTSDHTLTDWLGVHQIERPYTVASNGRRLMSAVCRRRMLDLIDNTDLPHSEIRATLTAEFPEMASFSSRAVYQTVTRRRKRQMAVAA